MIYDMTDRVKEVHEYFDKLLDERIEKISEISGVDKSKLKKINPADFIEKSRFQKIENYDYKNIKKWIAENKTDDCYLISPLDAIEETAAQISYKNKTNIERKIRASKCSIVPVPKEVALDFFIRNHRQSAPLMSYKAICLGLVYKSELVAVMFYDQTSSAIRGKKDGYELVRLSFAKCVQVNGGASKLQHACEDVLRKIGVSEIFSYSNATINNGKVYEKLGFCDIGLDGGKPYVIDTNNKMDYLINFFPDSTDEKLARKGRLKTHIGGNKFWKKDIGLDEKSES